MLVQRPQRWLSINCMLHRKKIKRIFDRPTFSQSTGDIETMLIQRWANFESTLCQRLVFAGMCSQIKPISATARH